MVKLGYKHLETDDEFIARLHAKYPWWFPGSYSDGIRVKMISGSMLDAEVLEIFGAQRKIVEVFP